jgi:DNA-directed RNA polymerase specialized sigma24 family protein
MSGEAKALAHCMAALEGLQRQAIGLAYFRDLSYSELAAQLELLLPAGPILYKGNWLRVM